MARFAGSGSFAGATKTDGCSHQKEEYSVREVDERMKGGAVMEERSPLKDANDCVSSHQHGSIHRPFAMQALPSRSWSMSLWTVPARPMLLLWRTLYDGMRRVNRGGNVYLSVSRSFLMEKMVLMVTV